MPNVQNAKTESGTGSIRVDIPINLKVRLVTEKAIDKNPINQTVTDALTAYYARKDSVST